MLYHVRWRGYSSSFDTWEPYENLNSCANLIDNYLQEKHQASAQQNCATPSDGQQQDQSRKKPSYFYVNSSDDESTAPKESFWKDLECGKIDVFSNDMYSSVKGQGRPCRPQSFQGMYGKRRRRNAPASKPNYDASAKDVSLDDAPVHDIDERCRDIPAGDAPPASRLPATRDMWHDSEQIVDVTQNSNDSTDSMAQLGEVKESFEQLPDQVENSGTVDGTVGRLTENNRPSTSNTTMGTSAVTTATDSTVSDTNTVSTSSNAHHTKCSSHTNPMIVNLQLLSAKFNKLKSKKESVVTTTTANTKPLEAPTVCVSRVGDVLTVTSPVQCIVAPLETCHPIEYVDNSVTAMTSTMSPCTKTAVVNTKSQGGVRDEKLHHTLDERQRDTKEHVEQMSDKETNEEDDDKEEEEAEEEEEGVFQLNLDVWLPDVTNIPNSQPDLVSTAAKFAEAVHDNDYISVSRSLTSNLKSCDIHQVDKFGRTLVMVAAERNYNDILELLVSYGADVNAVSQGHVTAAMIAAQQGFCCTVELLQLLGAHLNKQTLSHDTALLLAVRRGHPHIVRLLLDHGANFSCPTSKCTALALAASLQDNTVTDIIRTHVNRVTVEFQRQISASVKGAARTNLQSLFALQCLRLCESDVFTIIFEHQLTSTKPNSGMLLFVAHAMIDNGLVRCRLHGTSAVKLASLNGTTLSPVTKEKNFVFTFGPLHNGLNKLLITTEKAPTSKVKLLVCAYKADIL